MASPSSASYQAEEKREMNHAAAMRYLKPKMQEAEERGLQQGMHERSLDIARKMRDRGMDFSLIRELTGVGGKDLHKEERLTMRALKQCKC